MPNVTIFNGSRIGKHCKIFPGAVIGAIPQDLKYNGEQTTAEIGDYTTIREYVTIHLGTKDKWKTKVGNNCLLMAYAHVAHDCIVGNNVILAKLRATCGQCMVDDYAIIRGLTGAHQFTHVGAHAYVAGHVVIRKDVPPYVKAARDPLTFAGINKVGLSRRGFPKSHDRRITKYYHLLFVQAHSTSKAIELIESSLPDSLQK
jgi:UDP-N-acetylglucosamine acyltransferase